MPFCLQLPTKNKSVGNLKFVYLKLIVLYFLKINEKEMFMRKKYLVMLLLIISIALFDKGSVGDEDSYFKNGNIKNNLGK